MADELKPCAFCGCRSITTYRPMQPAGSSRMLALCGECGATADVKAWNRRAADRVDTELLAPMRSRLSRDQLGAIAYHANEISIRKYSHVPPGNWKEESPGQRDRFCRIAAAVALAVSDPGYRGEDQRRVGRALGVPDPIPEPEEPKP